MMKGDGFLLVNKPKGLTSFGAIRYLQKITGLKKIGHSGILDPLAEGLLLVALGRKATKSLSKFFKLDKEYLATIELGAISDTYDLEGKITKIKLERIPSQQEIKKTLRAFIGEIEQIPPLFSAKRIKGKRAYELARKGFKFNLKPQKVKIYRIEMIAYSYPLLKIRVFCSSGTYIRSLANDLGKKLGCGAYLKGLIRTKIGKFKLEEAVDLLRITPNNWQDFLLKNLELKN